MSWSFYTIPPNMTADGTTVARQFDPDLASFVCEGPLAEPSPRADVWIRLSQTVDKVHIVDVYSRRGAGRTLLARHAITADDAIRFEQAGG